MEEEQLKFRIKVVERMDGAETFHPQVYIDITKIKRGFDYVSESLNKNKKEYQWLSFFTSCAGLNCCTNPDDNGLSFTFIHLAHKAIERFKIDYWKWRNEADAKKEASEKNKTKTVTYIEIP